MSTDILQNVTYSTVLNKYPLVYLRCVPLAKSFTTDNQRKCFRRRSHNYSLTDHEFFVFKFLNLNYRLKMLLNVTFILITKDTKHIVHIM